LYDDEIKESTSVFQYNMLDVTPSQKFCVNMDPVLTGYVPVDVFCHNLGVCVSVKLFTKT
jgi:hypothetical protein